MNEDRSKFERDIIEQLKEVTPPEEAVKNINPWSRPIGFIIWGLVLSTIKLNFLYLQYLLPNLGSLLNYLGFRSLRDENKYFKTLWVFSIVKLFIELADIVRISTPLIEIDYFTLPLSIVFTALQVSILLIFHKGLEEVHHKAGRTMEGSPLISAAIWKIVAAILAVSALGESWLTAIPMLISYLFIVRSLFSISKQMDYIGYDLNNASIRVDDRFFGRIYFIILIILALSFNIYSNHTRLESRDYIKPNMDKSREHLIGIGFPESDLDYLNAREVDLIKDAISIEVQTETLTFDQEGGKKYIDSSTIFIEMPENTLYVMQIFRWSGAKFIWQDGIIITGDNEVDNRELIASGLFYSKGEKEYLADFPNIRLEQVQQNSMFGSYSNKAIRATLSFPFRSHKQGGYIFYRYGRMSADIYLMPHLFNYLHQSIPVRIPYRRAEDLILNGSYGFPSTYGQSYTTYESLDRQNDKDIRYEILE